MDGNAALGTLCVSLAMLRLRHGARPQPRPLIYRHTVKMVDPKTKASLAPSANTIEKPKPCR
jgi:hypothetical protein